MQILDRAGLDSRDDGLTDAYPARQFPLGETLLLAQHDQILFHTEARKIGVHTGRMVGVLL